LLDLQTFRLEKAFIWTI